MLNTFRAYDPSTINTKSYSTACETCYARKVKCELLEDGATCKQCADHGVKCKPRTRKRKVQSQDGSLRDYDNNGSNIPHSNSSKDYQPDSEAPSAPTRRMSNLSTPKAPPRPVRGSSMVSVPELFVNRDPNTEFSPEGSEHTEPATQDKFRNASFLSRSAILGDDFQDIDHAHADRTVNEDKVSSIELKVLKLRGAFDLPDLPLRQSLIEAYIERCYTWMPVIDLLAFTGTSQPGDGSLLLLQAVILVGALMRPDVCTKIFCDRQYQRVKALILSGYERNPLNILAALCLVQWYTPTAPKDISTDLPRFWNTYAVGIAQQMGLQRPAGDKVANPRLRSRIWWTMVARDNLTASAHGRPRIIQPEDCTASPPTTHDFGKQADVRADIFVYYVEITRILGDLCQFITRKGEASPEDKQNIGLRLHGFLDSLPEHLRLYSPSGLAQKYNLELAQLHVPILIAVAILYRPRSVFQLTAANAASATAAFLSFRVFQAIQLREQTRFLGSIFSWHLLVTAIPLLSCAKVAALRNEADEALDAVDNVLETLGRVRASAANNLRSVRAIRKAMGSKSPCMGSTAGTPGHTESQDLGSIQLGYQILQAYGQEAIQQYEQIADILGAHSNNQADRSAHAAAHTLSALSGRHGAVGMNNGGLTPDTDAYLTAFGVQEDIQNAFTAVFEDVPLNSSWMMRDWMDELQL